MKQVFVLLVSTFLLSACIGATEPTETAITFKTDAISCPGTAAIEITIDGENRGVFSFPPGGEWSFPVSPGDHSIKAEGEIPELAFILLDPTHRQERLLGMCSPTLAYALWSRRKSLHCSSCV